MRLSDRVHLVGSGRLGFALSEDHDCNIYLIDGGSELAVVDTGAGYQRGQLAPLIRQAGFDPARIGTILLTHKHADHSGGAAELAELTGAVVLASGATAAAISDGDAFNRGLDRARRTGSYPADYRFRPVTSVRTIAAGDEIAVGSARVRVLDAAGHCAGHLAFLLDDGTSTAVFSGDALFPGGEIVLQAIPDCSIVDSIATVAALEQLRFDALFPGHQCPVLRGGYRHASLAMARVRAGQLPEQLRVPRFPPESAPAGRPAG